jgi:AraC-like DNA-binding protein
MSLTRTILFNNDLLQIRHVLCKPEDRACSDFEESPADVMVMPVRGSFLQHFSDGTHIVAEPSQALFFEAGHPYRISHSIAKNDECLAFEFSPEIWKELLNERNFRKNSLLSNKAIHQRSILWKRLLLGFASEIEAVEISISLLQSALVTVKDVAKRPSSENRRTEQIDAVKIALLKQPDKKWTLTELAKEVSLSPFHLTRIFGKYVGTSLHQYHLRIKIAETVNDLLNTKKEITEIAFNHGFSSHSHFTLTFRRMIGITPGEFRQSVNFRTEQETRKKLIAN